MKLYGFTASPNTWKVRALAAYLKIPLAFEFLDLTKGGQRTSDYLALSPTGRTPTLVDGDFTLWESDAILQYLAGKTASTLWPKDPRGQADVTRWLCWQLAHWGAQACQPLTFERLVKKLVNLGPPDEAAVAKATESFNKEATMLDTHLGKHKYLVGDTLTVADFSVAAALIYSKQAEMPLGPYTNVRAWFERVMALPCWGETAPQFSAAA
ncbi:MAG TPA: glutathione S-transferase family protein [Xanthobacteraceae bacterium]|jgi:glutathione S-transferase|nr:glutathione S-transferase family protein [Xanthobacteraceae bacterium]